MNPEDSFIAQLQTKWDELLTYLESIAGSVMKYAGFSHCGQVLARCVFSFTNSKRFEKEFKLTDPKDSSVLHCFIDCSVMSESLQPEGFQHTRLPIIHHQPLYSDSHPLSFTGSTNQL